MYSESLVTSLYQGFCSRMDFPRPSKQLISYISRIEPFRLSASGPIFVPGLESRCGVVEAHTPLPFIRGTAPRRSPSHILSASSVRLVGRSSPGSARTRSSGHVDAGHPLRGYPVHGCQEAEEGHLRRSALRQKGQQELCRGTVSPAS